VPSAPNNLTATGDCNFNFLTWDAAVGASQYVISRTSNPDCSTSLAQVGVTSNTTYDDVGAQPHHVYYYRVQAENECGESGYSNCDSAECTGDPSAPTGLYATPTCNSIDLSWNVSTDAIEYGVRRTTNPDCMTDIMWIAGTTGTTYSDTSALAGVTYYYVVDSYDGCETSDYSNCASGIRLEGPDTPTNLTATGNCSAVSLDWDDANGANSYDIFRTEQSDCTTGLTQIDSTTLSYYADTAAVPGTMYYYRVQTVGDCGSSDYSNCASDTKQSVPDPPDAPTYTGVGCTSLTVNWNAVPGATTYDLHRIDGSCGGGDTMVFVNITNTYFNQSSLTENTQYSFYVIARNSCGPSADGTCSSVWTYDQPAIPTGLTTNPTCTSIDLSWNAADGATSYRVWRTLNSNCSTGLTSLGTTVNTTFSDTTAASGTTYYYVVTSSNTCGDSDYSNCDSGTRNTVPASPTNVTATGACDGIQLDWDAMPTATSYTMWRTTNSNCATGNPTFGSFGRPHEYLQIGRCRNMPELPDP